MCLSATKTNYICGFVTQVNTQFLVVYVDERIFRENTSCVYDFSLNNLCHACHVAGHPVFQYKIYTVVPKCIASISS